MITQFDFFAFGCVAVLTPIFIEAIQNLIGEEKITNKKLFALVVTAVVALIVLICKFVFVEKPTWDIQFWAMNLLFIIFSAVASQVTFDKVIKVIEQLIIQKLHLK